jgi:hypothetical protein
MQQLEKSAKSVSKDAKHIVTMTEDSIDEVNLAQATFDQAAEKRRKSWSYRLIGWGSSDL